MYHPGFDLLWVLDSTVNFLQLYYAREAKEYAWTTKLAVTWLDHHQLQNHPFFEHHYLRQDLKIYHFTNVQGGFSELLSLLKIRKIYVVFVS